MTENTTMTLDDRDTTILEKIVESVIAIEGPAIGLSPFLVLL